MAAVSELRVPVALLSLSLAVACAVRAAPGAPASREWIPGPRGRLRVDDGGEGGGVPVVFVHGNGGNRTQWAATLAHVRRPRRGIAFDLAGMGDSELLPGEPISVEGFARDIEAVADAAGPSRFVLVGHSYGGAVIAAYAGMRPDRLAGLVFADSAGDLHDTPDATLEPLRRGLRDDYRRFTEKWFESILTGARPETREAVLTSLRRTRPEVFIGATEAAYRFHLDAALARYRGPRLSIASWLFGNPDAIHRTTPAMPIRRMARGSPWPPAR